MNVVKKCVRPWWFIFLVRLCLRSAPPRVATAVAQRRSLRLCAGSGACADEEPDARVAGGQLRAGQRAAERDGLVSKLAVRHHRSLWVASSLSKSLAERRRVGCTGCLPAAVAARPDSERAVSSARSSGLWWSRSPWTKRGGSRPRSSATRRRVRHRHCPTTHDSCSDSTHV